MTLIEVDKLLALFGDWYVEEGTAEGFIGTIKNLIETVPTIEQPHWIPCSERLPALREEVLATDGQYVWCANRVWYIDAELWEDLSTGWTIENVIAWMPLPEPYKEDEE